MKKLICKIFGCRLIPTDLRYAYEIPTLREYNLVSVHCYCKRCKHSQFFKLYLG